MVIISKLKWNKIYLQVLKRQTEINCLMDKLLELVGIIKEDMLLLNEIKN